MAVELNDGDRKILALLLKDGRIPTSQIADQVGLSRPAVAERIEKLERLGVIRGTTAVVDPIATNRTVTAFVAAHGAGLTRDGWDFLRDLMRGDEFLELHTVAGEDCYLIKVRTDSISSLNDIVAKLKDPPLSLATRTTIVMQTHYEKVGGLVLGDPL